MIIPRTFDEHRDAVNWEGVFDSHVHPLFAEPRKGSENGGHPERTEIGNTSS